MPKVRARIRLMTAGDFPAAARLSREAGWNQLEADWRRFLGMQPDGCFVAECRGDCVGTVVTCIFDQVAWIAMLLVDAAERGRGIGRALVQHTLAFLDQQGIGSVRLDATALGQPLYEKLGFQPQFELARYAGAVTGPIDYDDSKSWPQVRRAQPADVESVMAFDTAITSTDRRKLLDRLFGERPDALRMVERAGEIEGYLTVRSGRCAVQLGPCLAAASAGPALFADAAAIYAGQPVVLDVPISNLPAIRVTESLGLKVQRTFIRMCRGPEIQEDVARLWASSGPELG